MNALKDIRCWIFFFFLVRLYGITLPPLEVAHNIRQIDGLMIARNFYERDNNIFYPTTDVAGEKSGVVGCEFPLLNYCIYLFSCVWGFENWFGRLINLIVSSAGVFFFFKLIRKHFTEEVAFNASMILLASLWFTYSRKNLPDTFAASLCMVSLFFSFRYLEEGKIYDLLLFFIAGLFGCMSKISACCLMTVLAIPVLAGEYQLPKKITLIVASLFILTAVYWWYFLWVPHLNATYGFSMFFMGMSFSEGATQLLDNLPITLKRFYDSPLKYSGFAIFLLGIFFAVSRKSWLALAAFGIPFVAFLLVVVKSGANFVVNEYYILVITPAMAFMAGWGLTQINSKKLVVFLLVLVCTEGIVNKLQDFRVRPPLAAIAQLEGIMNSLSNTDDLIATNTNESGAAMFFSHRRGWRSNNELLSNSGYVETLKKKGCKYILIVKQLPGVNIELPLQSVYDSEYFKVYKL